MAMPSIRLPVDPRRAEERRRGGETVREHRPRVEHCCGAHGGGGLPPLGRGQPHLGVRGCRVVLGRGARLGGESVIALGQPVDSGHRMASSHPLLNRLRMTSFATTRLGHYHRRRGLQAGCRDKFEGHKMPACFGLQRFRRVWRFAHERAACSRSCVAAAFSCTTSARVTTDRQICQGLGVPGSASK